MYKYKFVNIIHITSVCVQTVDALMEFDESTLNAPNGVEILLEILDESIPPTIRLTLSSYEYHLLEKVTTKIRNICKNTGSIPIIMDEKRIKHVKGKGHKGKIVFVPDTNFFVYHPNFINFFDSFKGKVYLNIHLSILRELDGIRKGRNSNREDERKRGEAADKVINLINSIFDNSYNNIDITIAHPEQNPVNSLTDVQIVAYAINLAKVAHKTDRIIFITDDRGLPTILFKEATNRQNFKNLTLMTSSQLQKELPSLGDAHWIDLQLNRSRF